MKLVLILTLLISSAFAQTRQQIIDEGNRLIDNASYSGADQRTLNRVLNMVQRANLLLEQDSIPGGDKNCEITGGNSWVYINVDGNRVHSIYNNSSDVLSKISSLNCKNKSLEVSISSSNSWSYIKVNGVNIFSIYNNGDLLMSALERIDAIEAFNIKLSDATLSSSNSWVYIRLSGHNIYSFYNNTDLAILKIEQYPILKNLFRRARNKCRVSQSNGWSYVYFNENSIYSYYNNWNSADKKLSHLVNLGLCLR
jgi:hypothetical protein